MKSADKKITKKKNFMLLPMQNLENMTLKKKVIL